MPATRPRWWRATYPRNADVAGEQLDQVVRGDADDPAQVLEPPGLGGVVIEQGPGLGSVPWIAALVTVSGIAVALWSARLDTPRRIAIEETATCPAN